VTNSNDNLEIFPGSVTVETNSFETTIILDHVHLRHWSIETSLFCDHVHLRLYSLETVLIWYHIHMRLIHLRPLSF